MYKKVYKLGALDAGFLYNETARSPQHIASVQILELPEGVSEAQYLSNLKAMLLERIHLVPYFTNKLQFVPFDLDHPVWVRDSNFDIDNHVLTMEEEASQHLCPPAYHWLVASTMRSLCM